MKVPLKRTLFFHFVISVLMNVFLSSFDCSAAGTVYTDSAEYVKAFQLHDHQLKSYVNYKRKRDLYSKLVIPDLNHAPVAWVEDFFSPKMQAAGIQFDNYVIRYFPDVEPSGNEYVVVYQPSIGSPELRVRFSDHEEAGPGVIISVFYYAFKHPGDPPVFNTTVTSLNPASAGSPAGSSSSAAIPVHDPDFESRYYVMPDGRRYSYAELLRSFPSMKFDEVFKKSF